MAEENVNADSVGGAVGQEVKAENDKPKLSEAEVTAILDAIFTKGSYEEEVELPRNHRCVFRTRTSKQAIDISAYLDKDDPSKMTRVRYNQLYSLYCLAMSLVSFDGEELPQKFEEKVILIGGWAGPLIDLLLEKLIEFDKKVADAYTVEQVKN